MGFHRYWINAFKGRFKNLLLALRFFWECSPKTAGLSLALVILAGLFPLLMVNVTRHVINQFDSIENIRSWLTGSGLLLLLTIIGREAIHLLGNLIRTFHEGRVSDYVNSRAQQIASSADMAHYESSTFYDHLYRAGFESDQHVIDVTEHMAAIVSGTITLLGLLFLVGRYSSWLPIVFFAASLPVFLTLITQSHKRYQWNQSMTKIQRKSRYLNWLLVGQESAGELRIYGLQNLLVKKYKELREKVLLTRTKLEQKQALWVSGANVLSLCLLGGGIALLTKAFQSGAIDNGSVALIGHSILLCRQSTQTLLSETASLYRASLFLADLDYVINLKPQINAPEKPKNFTSLVHHEIRFSNVSFTYPEMEAPAIKHLTVTIPPKKLTVILGKNGSGKSTLGKMLCRFFDPDDGEITLGEIPLKAFDPKQLRNHLGCLFQDPVRYYFSAEENVIFGNTDIRNDPKAFAKAINSSMAASVISDLPNGKDTQLGRWFQEGTELSGGQWQRLALARTHYANRPIWILDEPTSAMDPWTEKKWLENTRQDAVDKTIILITHRISSAAIADHLIVMDSGQVVESGSPSELLEQRGIFAKLYNESATQFPST
jgi:ATP-binding cassette subfamily B protein